MPVPMPPVYSVPEHWEKCELLEDCENYGTLNKLSCRCFADAQCDIWCGEDMTQDPVNGCDCISKDDYRAYFPEWASDKDIDYSFKIQY